MSLKEALVALYHTMSRGTRRRLKLAVVGMLVASGLDMIGLALVLPLMQVLTDAGDRSGMAGRVADLFGDPSRSDLVVILACLVFAAFVAKGLFSLAFRWWMLGFITRQKADAAAAMFERYMAAPYPFHLRRNSAELLRTLSVAVTGSYIGAVNAVLIIATEAVTAAGVLVVLFVAKPLPALGAIAYFGLIGFGFLRLIRRRATRAGDESMHANRESTQAALQGLGGVKEVLVRGTAPFFTGSYRKAQRRGASAQRTQLFLSESPKYVVEMLFIVGVAAMSVVLFSAGGTQEGAAVLGLFVAAGFRLLPSLTRMMASTAALRVAIPAITLVLDDLVELPEQVDSGQAARPVRLSDRIRIDTLRYRYPETERDVLHGVSLDVPVGHSVAIVGSSGAGKTTVIDILLGLLEPTEGRVTIDGADLADIRPQWQHSIGLVPQDVYLFDDTLRANIAFGQPSLEIDDKRIAEAVKRAQLHEMVAGLPDGLETVVGERGVRLSGGQLQRIGIARALYLRPQLLVLDEATSALDNVTERKITSTIEALHGEVTMIVVAHRLSTVRRCDKIVFMNEGRVETVGTFDEVRDANSTFAHLVQLGSLESLQEPAEAAL